MLWPRLPPERSSSIPSSQLACCTSCKRLSTTQKPDTRNHQRFRTNVHREREGIATFVTVGLYFFWWLARKEERDEGSLRRSIANAAGQR